MSGLARRRLLALLAGAAAALRALPAAAAVRIFDVEDYGAAGDGRTPDTQSIQRAIDAAAAAGGGARVLLRRGRTYLTGPLRLAAGIDFRVDGVLRVSIDPADYAQPSLLHAKSAPGLTISGSGTIDGRSPEFMERYDAADEWWIPKAFRPRLIVLEDCERLTIRGVTIVDAPSWTVHLVGCRGVLVDGITIRNQRDVPNCDGIDPDHCQDVVIRNCRITCGDDATVIKTTAAFPQYGPSTRIHVHDCVLDTQDSGLKIGTETTQDIHDIRFERCRIVSSCRGLTIQLRDPGDVHDILFRDVDFVSRYHSAPWWGRGEAISFTAIPRNADTKVGTIRDVRVERVRGRAENSVRIEGLGGGRVRDVTLERVDLTLGRTTAYPGAVFDNRPTAVVPPIEPHPTPAISIRNAEAVTLRDCAVRWSGALPESFTHALQAENAPGLTFSNFRGEAAHPERFAAIRIS
ncbi:glycoside hydrolase [Sphingomonas parva]|uniref:Glycoside hydrolase n=1 Tax=Sphingomonas parva TaxID=2555898 RepID=A0A4Y8ZNS4_9SPHN|nr:glycosyl hydrolase family 28 protein [Sphingomonas parva]TFI57658.1 glycoside hydrolase [Sphingomonas parva]